MVHIGGIADDFTGAIDLAGNLRHRGLTAVVVSRLEMLEPNSDAADQSLKSLSQVDAVVVALKTRTAPPAEAVEESLKTAKVLKSLGVKQVYFKICSTFDSTADGNIGPVLEALALMLGVDRVPVIPAFPENGRRVFQSHLFVFDQLLSNSSMRSHPLTPMKESDLRRVLAPQTSMGVYAITEEVVSRGENAVREELKRLPKSSAAIVDTICDRDLEVLGKTLENYPLVVAGSGLALGYGSTDGADALPRIKAPLSNRLVLCGSASKQTQKQLAYAKSAGSPVVKIRVNSTVSELVQMAKDYWQGGSPLPFILCTTESDDDVPADESIRNAQAEVFESILASVAAELIPQDCQTLIVAGGETSGRVTTELDAAQLSLGDRIAPGVSWATFDRGEQAVAIALKSGNFGNVSMFADAWELLDDVN